MDGLSVHQYPDVGLWGQAAQRWDYRVLAHHSLPEDPVSVLYWDVYAFVFAAVGNLSQDIVGPFAGDQPVSGESNTHVADRVGEKVWLPGI